MCVSGRLAGSVWPPVFTHKQSNLQSDQPVWVWSPVSHSPSDTLPPQTQAYSGHQEVASEPLFSSQTLFTAQCLSRYLSEAHEYDGDDGGFRFKT